MHCPDLQLSILYFRIVSVGGDGMFSECVNGLLSRLQKDTGVNMDDPENDITPSNIPIGIVPAGKYTGTLFAACLRLYILLHSTMSQKKKTF